MNGDNNHDEGGILVTGEEAPASALNGHHTTRAGDRHISSNSNPTAFGTRKLINFQ